MPRPARPLMRYYGGKWRIAPWICGHMPPHVCYVEPFAGSASVLLTKEPSPIEVLNDLDGDVVNLFRVLRDQPRELIRAIRRTPYSRAEVLLSLEQTDDPLERARRLYVRAWQAFGGARIQWNTGWRFEVSGERGSSIRQDWTNIRHLVAIARRLRQVGIEQDDALRILERFDRSTTLFYVDPPYLKSTRSSQRWDKAYCHELATDEEHAELLDVLNSLDGMVLLSGYDSPLYEEALEGWEVVATSQRDMKAKRRVECLWINPSAAALQRQQRLPLRAVST